MGKAGKPRKRRKRRRRGRSARAGGVLTGMRSGFKNVASAATGTGPAQQGKRSWVGTAITIVLLLAAVALIVAGFSR
jgi:hypothetical protein